MSSPGDFPGILFDQQASDEDQQMDESHLNVGYKVLNMMVEQFENEHSILKCFPTGYLYPQPFVEGSRQKLEKVAAAVKMKLGNDFPGVVLQWEQFLAKAPQSDDADEYVRENPLYIPFTKELFGIDPENELYAHGRNDCVAKKEQSEQDVKAAAKEMEKEVWRTLPCMSKNTKNAVERVTRLKQDDGTITFEPFYTDGNSSGGDASSTDEDDAAIPRWCTVRRRCGVVKYGDASAYIGLTCTMSGEAGTITAVMKNSSIRNGELHFAVQVDADEADDASFAYIPCKDMMSTNKKSKYKVSSKVHACICVCPYEMVHM
jgi:hypothetical protein